MLIEYLQAAVVRACLYASSHHGANMSHPHMHTDLYCTRIHPYVNENTHNINPIHKTDKLTRVTVTTSRSCRDKYMLRTRKGFQPAAKYINFSHFIEVGVTTCQCLPKPFGMVVTRL